MERVVPTERQRIGEINFHFRQHDVVFQLDRVEDEYHGRFLVWGPGSDFKGGRTYIYQNSLSLNSYHRAIILGGYREIKTAIQHGLSFTFPLQTRIVEEREIGFWNLEIVKGVM